MKSISCSFCRVRIKTEKGAKPPGGWGIIHARQGRCEVDFIHCPKHQNLKNCCLWTLIDLSKKTTAKQGEKALL